MGATDWVDGWLARRFNQVSEFGKMFDPTADRLLFIAAISGILIKGIPPLGSGWSSLRGVVRRRDRIATLFFGMKRFDVTWWQDVTLLMFAARFQARCEGLFAHQWFLVALMVSPACTSYHRDHPCPHRPRQPERALSAANVAGMQVPEQPVTARPRVSVSGNRARIGITDSRDALAMSSTQVTQSVTAGDSFGEVESTKSVSDVYALLTGTVVAVNDRWATALRR